MISRLNALIGKKFDKENYHCYDFIKEILDVPSLKDVSVANAKNDIEKYSKIFTKIDVPEEVSIIEMNGMHVGICIDGSHVYHNDKYGVRCESLRNIKAQYKNLTYYRFEDGK